jgi:photosystem II stability/assembly factor-like uncharacterized protein
MAMRRRPKMTEFDDLFSNSIICSLKKRKTARQEAKIVIPHPEVYAGTAGHSAWFSADLGQTWVHPNSQSGLYLEARVWAFSSHAAEPDLLYAGSDMGLYRWDERSTRWQHLDTPMADIWALAQDPADPRVLWAGARPAGLFQSPDAGRTWEQRPLPGLQAFSDINMGPTRVTQLLFDPVDADTLWATVEVGGIYRSRDRGRSWTAQVEGLVSADVHGIAVIRDAGGRKRVFATTNRGLHCSGDDGERWVFQPLDSPWQYTRAIVAPPGRDTVLFLTNGNGPPGNTGRLLRSRDHGASWQPMALPGTLNSTPWCIAAHAGDPMRLFMGTNLGQLFRSSDGGEHWERLPHEFGELRALHWRLTGYPATRPAHSITVRPPVVAGVPA